MHCVSCLDYIGQNLYVQSLKLAGIYCPFSSVSTTRLSSQVIQSSADLMSRQLEAIIKVSLVNGILTYMIVVILSGHYLGLAGILSAEVL